MPNLPLDPELILDPSVIASFTGADAQTGVYLDVDQANSSVLINTESTTALYIDKYQNLGVNTGSPTSQLTINSATGECVELRYNNDNEVTGGLTVSSDGKLQFGASGSEVSILSGNSLNVKTHNGSSTGLMLNDVLVRATANQINYNVVTPGSASNSKALILDSNGAISGIASLSATDVTGTLQTASQPNITSVGTLNGLTIADGTNLTIGSTIVNQTDFSYVNGVTPGTASASKSLIVDTNKNISGINSLSASDLTGTLQTSDQPNVTSLGTLVGLNMNGYITGLTQLSVNSTVTGRTLVLNDINGECLQLLYDNGSGDATTYVDFIVSNNGSLLLTPSGGSVDITTHNGSTTGLKLGGVLIQSTSDEINYLHNSSPGSAVAGKALVVNSSRNINNINNLTATNLTGTLQTTDQPNISSVNVLNVSQHDGENQGLSLNGTLITAIASELNYLDGSVPGTASAGNAVVLDSSGDIININNLTASQLTGTLQTAAQPNIESVTTLDITGHDGSTAGLKLDGVLVTATASQINSIFAGTSGGQFTSLTADNTVTITNANGIDKGLILGSTLITASGTELNYLDGATPGTASAGNALVLDSSGDIVNINNLTASQLTGTLQTASQPNITSVTTLNITGHNGTNAGLSLGGSLVTSTSTELNYLHGSTPGTATASNALVLNSSKNISSINSLSANSLSIVNTGNLGIDNLYNVTSGTNLSSNNNERSLCAFSPTLNMAIFTGNEASASRSYIMYSSNTLAFTGELQISAISNYGGSAGPFGCVWNSTLSKFIIYFVTGDAYTSAYSAYYVTSSNGTTWDSSATSMGLNIYKGTNVIYHSNSGNWIFAAGNKFYYSSNGTSWSSITLTMTLDTSSFNPRMDAIVSLGNYATVNIGTSPRPIIVWNGSTWSQSSTLTIGNGSVRVAYHIDEDRLYGLSTSGNNGSTAASVSLYYIDNVTTLTPANWTAGVQTTSVTLQPYSSSYPISMRYFSGFDIVASTGRSSSADASYLSSIWFAQFKNKALVYSFYDSPTVTSGNTYRNILTPIMYVNNSNQLVLSATATGSSIISVYANLPIAGKLIIGSTQITESEIGVLDSVTPGIVSASRVVVVDASKNISTINSLTATSITGTLQTGSQPNITSVSTLDITGHNGTTAGLKLGGVLVTATAAELNSLTDGTYSTTLTMVNGTDIQVTGTEATSIFSNWNTTTTMPSASWTKMAYSPELGVFIALAGASSMATASYSTDGITWTSKSLPSTRIWTDICWSSDLNKFFIVSDCTSTSTNGFAYSADGITWTATNAPVSGVKFTSISCIKATGILMVGYSAANYYYYSSTGLTNSWSNTGMITGGKTTWSKVAYSPKLGLYAAVRYDEPGPANIDLLWGSTLTSGEFGGSTLFLNGSLMSGYTKYMGNLIWVNELGMFYGVSGDTTYANSFFYSTNPSSGWTVTNAPSTGLWTKVIWAKELGLLICISKDSTPQMITSRDGINWSTVTLPSNLPTLSDIMWIPAQNKLVVISSTSGATIPVFLTQTSNNSIYGLTTSSANSAWKSRIYANSLTSYDASIYGSHKWAYANTSGSYIANMRLDPNGLQIGPNSLSEASSDASLELTQFNSGGGLLKLKGYGTSSGVTYTLSLDSSGNLLSKTQGTSSFASGVYRMYHNLSVGYGTFTASSNYSNGAMIVYGGCGISGALNVNGGISGTLTTAAQGNITSLGTLTGLSVNGTLYSYGTLYSTAQCQYKYTADATSMYNGANQFSGGAGFQKSVYAAAYSYQDPNSFDIGLLQGATQSTGVQSTSSKNAIAYSPSLGIYILAKGTLGSNSTSGAASSPDGINWTSRSTPAVANSTELTTAIWAGGSINKFFIGGYTSASNTVVIHSSTNGTSWTQVSASNITTISGFGGMYATQMIYVPENGTIYMVGYNGNTKAFIYSSTDGSTWTGTYPSSSLTTGIMSIAYNTTSQLLVAGLYSNSSYSIATSSDNGVTWVMRTTDTSYIYNTVVCDNTNNIMVAVPISSSSTLNKVIRSTDGGATWNTISISNYGINWYRFMYLPNINVYFLLGSNGWYYLSSNGGTTWSAGATNMGTVNNNSSSYLDNVSHYYNTTTGYLTIASPTSTTVFNMFMGTTNVQSYACTKYDSNLYLKYGSKNGHTWYYNSASSANIGTQLMTLTSTGLSITGNTTTSGTLTVTAGTLTLNSTSILEADIQKLNSITSGTASASKAIVLDGSKNISGINNISAAALSLSSTFATTNTTNSSSTSTGSIVTAGGVGIAQDVFIGGKIDVTGVTALHNTVSLTDTTNATDSESGSLVLAGGIGIAQDVFIGGKIDVTGITALHNTVSLTDTTNATDSESGSLVLAGGVGIAQDVFIGGMLNVGGHFILAGDETAGGSLFLSGTTNSTSKDTGTLVVDGGVGIELDTFIGGKIDVTGTTTLRNTVALIDTTNATDIETASLVLAGGMGVAKDVFVGGLFNVGGYFVLNGDQTNGAILTITGTTNSTSSSTGTLIVDGGMGIVMDTYIGGSLNISTNLNVTGTQTNSGTLSVNNTTNSTSTSTGAITTTGGLAVAQDTYIGGDLNVVGTINLSGTLSANSSLTLTDTTNSTSPTTGTLVVNGGVGIGMDVFIGNNLDVIGLTTLHDLVAITDDSNSTSTSTGCLVLAGGIGIAQDVFIGGKIDITGVTALHNTVSLTDTTNATDSESGSLVLAGGVGIAQDVFIGGMLNVGGHFILAGDETAGGSLFLSGTTNSTSKDTGTLVVDGGVGIELDTFIGGKIDVTGTTTLHNTVSLTSTTNSTSKDTGALIIDGGVGIELDTFIGGKLDVTGVTTLRNTVSLTSTTNSTSKDTGALIIDGGVGIELDTFIGGKIDVTGVTALHNTVSLTDTTNATDSESGSLVLAGGVGIAQDVFIGGMLNVGGHFILAGDETAGGSLFLSGTTNSTSKDTGTLVVDGGVGIELDTFIGGKLNVTDTVTLHNIVSLTDTTNAADVETASLVLAGGVGIAQDVFIGGSVDIASNLSLHGDQSLIGTLAITNTTNSTSTSTGSIKTTGGIGIAKDIIGGGKLDITGTTTLRNTVSLTDTTNATDSESGSLVLAGGVGIAQDVFIGGMLNVGGHFILAGDETAGGSLFLSGTTNSTSKDTGTLVVDGGVGIELDTFIGGKLDVTDVTTLHNVVSLTDTTNATDVETASLVLAGGMGIAQDVFIGGSLTLNGQLINNTDLSYLHSITPGTASATKALVVDSNKDISSIRNLSATNLTGTLQTASQPNITSVNVLNITGYNGSNAGLSFNGGLITSSATELNYLDGSTPGSATTGNALVVDGNRDIENINALIASELTGTLQTASQPNITSVNVLNITGYNGSDAGLSFNDELITSNATELNYLDGSTPGTATAENALIVDSNKDIVSIRNLSATNLTGTLQTAAQANITSVGTLNGLTIAESNTFTINSTTMNETDLSYLVGITPGSASATKALIIDSNRDISDIHTLSTTNLTATNLTGTLQTAAQANITSVGSLNGLTIASSNTFTIGSTTMNETDLSYLVDITPGSAAAYKALILDDSLDITGINSLIATNLTGTLQTAAQPNITSVTTLDITGHDGSSAGLSLNSVLITASASELNYVDTTPGSAQASKALILDSSLNIAGIHALTATNLTGTLQTAAQANITSVGSLNGLTISSTYDLTMGSTTITETEIGYLDGLTIGVVSASKALVVDADSSLSGINNLVATTLAIGSPAHTNLPLEVGYTSYAFTGAYAYSNSENSHGLVDANASAAPSNYSIRTDGKILCTSEIEFTSDRRLKTNITNITLETAKHFVENARPVKFNWKNGDEKPELGFVAQEVFKINEDLVNITPQLGMVEEIDDDGFISPANAKYTLATGKMIPLLTLTTKDLYQQLEEKDAKIAALEKRLAKLEEMFANLN